MHHAVLLQVLVICIEIAKADSTLVAQAMGRQGSSPLHDWYGEIDTWICNDGAKVLISFDPQGRLA